MRIQDIFDEIMRGELTTLEKVTFIEQVTEGYDVGKLRLLRQDLQQKMAGFQRRGGTGVFAEAIERFHEAFRRSFAGNEVLTSISKEQLIQFLSKNPDIAGSKQVVDLLKQAIWSGVDTHGESFAGTLLGYMQLKDLENLINERLRQVQGDDRSGLPARDPSNKGGRKATYDLEDTHRWFEQLSRDPDYQHSNGSPNIGAIDAELMIRHKKKTGQKPSFATIKNHRRELGFMQK